jgi:hypothetical protein
MFRSYWWIDRLGNSVIEKYRIRIIIGCYELIYNFWWMLYFWSEWGCHQRSRWISNCAFLLFLFLFNLDIFLTFNIFILFIFYTSIPYSCTLLSIFWFWWFYIDFHFFYLWIWKCWSSCYFFIWYFFYFIWGFLKFFSHIINLIFEY